MALRGGRFVLCCVCLAPAACQPARTGPAATSPPTPPGTIITEYSSPQRIEAMPGLPLMLTLDPRVNPPGTEISARLADGRALGTRIYNITIDSPRLPATSPALRAWIADPLLGKDWTSTDAPVSTPRGQRQTAALSPSLRVAKIDIPRDAVGPSLWIDDKPVAVQWLLDPESLVPAQPEYWPPMLPAPAASDAQLMQCLRDIARSPLQRWRVRLLIDGLLTLRPDVSKVGILPDPIAEAMAQQVEQRWRLALARLAQVDRAMAMRVKQRLCLVAALPGAAGRAQWVPAWPTDDVSIDRLRGDLANPRLSRGDLVAKAHQWLREQPQGAAWIVDDGGELASAVRENSEGSAGRGGGQRPVIFVGVTNLSDRAEAVAATFGDQQIDTQRIEPLESGQSRVMFVPPTPDAQNAYENVSVQLGRFTGMIPAATGLIGAQPPAFVASGLQQDLTLTTWQYGSNLTVTPTSISGVTVALSRIAGAEELPSPWRLRIQWPARAPGAGDQAAGVDQVELHVGPSSAPIAVISIDPSGAAVRTDVTDLQGPAQRGRTQAVDGGTAVTFDLPASFIEEGGILRLGIAHTAPGGIRSLWPRARLPWQISPGRAAIDLGAWSGLPGRE